MRTHRAWVSAISTMVIFSGALTPTLGLACGGGGGGDQDIFAGSPPPDSGGGGGGGGEGFGASPNAVAAWEAAGGRKGTGKSFQDWFKSWKDDWSKRQDDLTWDATKASWKASAWTPVVVGTDAADKLGKVSQFGLNFVPGVGKVVNIGLDGARGAAEGYGQAVEKGMSQADAAKTGAVTGTASGLLSAFTSKLGFAKDAGKAVQSAQAAKTAKQILKSKQALKTAFTGTTVQEGVKEVVGAVHTTSVVNNSAPTPQMTGATP